MIEEIKKEIIDLTPLFGNKEGVCILRKEVFEILDKYKDKEINFENGSSKFAIVKDPKLNVDNIKNYNQPDYKSAWAKLKKTVCINEPYDSYNDCGGKQTFEEVFDIFEELETKYNIGGK